jgi:aryl-alcohol dehydrogenase-like predicted oxidoreductase
LEAVEALRQLVPENASLAQLALRWILMFDAVTTVIPGAKNRQQAGQNAAAANVPALTEAQMAAVRQVYDTYIRRHVHDRW